MKNAILGCGAAALLLFAAACEKDRTVTPVPPSTDNMWRIGNTTYTAASTESSTAGGSYQVAAAVQGPAGVNGITFVFPTASRPEPGAYLAVTNFSGVGKEVKVFTQNDNGVSIVQYNTTGYDSIRATVDTGTQNRITINLPAAWALNAANSNDSVRISASGIKAQ